MLYDLFQENLHKVQIFVKEEKKHHAAAGESGHYQAQTSGLNTHRVTPVTLQELRGRYRSWSQTFAQRANVWDQDKTIPRCRRRIGPFIETNA